MTVEIAKTLIDVATKDHADHILPVTGRNFLTDAGCQRAWKRETQLVMFLTAAHEEIERLRSELVGSDERTAAVLDGTFSVGDGTAQREIERLRTQNDAMGLFVCAVEHAMVFAHHGDELHEMLEAAHNRLPDMSGTVQP